MCPAAMILFTKLVTLKLIVTVTMKILNVLMMFKIPTSPDKLLTLSSDEDHVCSLK